MLIGEGPTDDINDSICIAETKFSINFTKANTKFFVSLHYNGDESYFFVNKTVICKFKAHNDIPWYEFCLGSRSKDFTFNIRFLDLIFTNI